MSLGHIRHRKMGTILVSSLQGRRCHVLHDFSSNLDGENSTCCRRLAALFICTFGLTVCFCTKPDVR